MVGRDIGDYTHIAAVEAQSLTKDPPASGLQHGKIDSGILEHHLRRGWPRQITGGYLGAIDGNTIGAGHADLLASGGHDGGNHPCRHGLTVRTSNRDDWHSSRSSFTEKHVDDGTSDVPRMPFCGMGMHSETGP